MLSQYLKHLFSISGVSKIIECFEKENIEIKFVGGCIRDAIIGNNISDIDFAINCDPRTTSNILLKKNIKILDYAQKFGTITAVVGKNNFEITSLRKDVNQSGRFTEVIFTEDWVKDAKRRDFTINAMYLTSDGKLIDYFGGLNDLQENRIKFIGDIERRVPEDYLRIFRYYRFLGIFEKPQLIQGYEEVLKRNCEESFNYLSNDLLRQEILKMFNTSFPLNSFYNHRDKKKKRYWVKLATKHFTNTKYDLGLNKCLNKIDLLIN